jgi:HlyD family secretion protein
MTWRVDAAPVPGDRLSVRGPVRAGIVLALVLLAAAVAWVRVAPVHGVLTVPGRVEGALARQPVQHLDGGVVAEVHVAEGDRVAAGAVLLRLDGRALRSDLRQVEDQLAALMAEALRHAAERDGRASLDLPPDLAARSARDPGLAELVEGQAGLLAARAGTREAERAQLARRAERTEAEIAAIATEAQALAREQALVVSERADQGRLADRGLTPAQRLLALDREIARIDRQIATLASTRAAAEGRLAEIALEDLRLTAARREEAQTALGVLSPRVLALEERARALAAQLERLDLIAPVAGTVLASVVTAPGTVVRPAEPVMFLVPTDVPLTILADVPARSIGAVWPGQPARVELPGPGGLTRAEIAATVTAVSADALTAVPGVPRDAALPGAPAAFRVALRPVIAAGDVQPADLRPGMPVEVFLSTGAHSPLDWLAGSLSAYLVRAFRDG